MIVASHVPIVEEASIDDALVWNYKQVLEVLDSEDGRKSVVAVMAGGVVVDRWQSGQCCF